MAPAPAPETGYIAFGSFNNLSKVNPELIGLWARLLQAVPNARFLLKYHWLSDIPTRQRYYDLFSAHGIGPERLEFMGMTPSTTDHLGRYARMDIALDTFPYNGTTTTCEALWMGVPVVCLEGRSHHSRVGASLLSRIGLDDCIAQDSNQYIEIATRLARDHARRADLRARLRETLTNSSLCDGRAFTARIEDAYRTMWRRECAEKK